MELHPSLPDTLELFVFSSKMRLLLASAPIASTLTEHCGSCKSGREIGSAPASQVSPPWHCYTVHLLTQGTDLQAQKGDAGFLSSLESPREHGIGEKGPR